MVGRTHRNAWSWRRLLWTAKGLYYRWSHYRTQQTKAPRRHALQRTYEERRANQFVCRKKAYKNQEDYNTPQETARPRGIDLEDQRPMVKNTAFIIALLAALPTKTFANACTARVMTACESELYQVGITWEGRAREERAKLVGCEAKLATRTATVVKTLAIPCPPPLETPSVIDDIIVLISVGASGLGVGVLLGVLFSP